MVLDLFKCVASNLTQCGWCHLNRIAIRSFTTGQLRLQTHYDALGLRPNATHADIKSAYYRLSKLYHPDKNKGSDDASVKFREITAAYEVLGNFRLRKLYDKGIIRTADSSTAQAYKKMDVEDDPQTKFYKQRMNRTRQPTAPGQQQPIYDFDEWSRAHYGKKFEQAQQAKKRYKRDKEKEINEQNDIKIELLILLIMFGSICYMTFCYNQAVLDENRIKRESEKHSPDVKTV